MYCTSCRERLSPRDKNCPNCGRAAAKPNLGAGSSSAGDSKTFPLSPSSSWEEVEPELQLEEPAAAEPRPAKKKPRSGGAKAAPARSPRKKAAARKSSPEDRPREGARSMFTLRTDDVRKLVARQPDLIEPGLSAHQDTEGQDIGSRYATDVGEIDLLARDDAGAWVAVLVGDVEQGKDLVSEALQRVGWVRKHLAQEGQEVRGVVLLEALPEDLGYAASAVADTISFKIWRVELAFDDAEL
ncbi:MAG: hypothetical protein O7A09_09810 [Proteobacteria bacterium]|nr:hypothetical protein [Pseudomonadota bacterium]